MDIAREEPPERGVVIVVNDHRVPEATTPHFVDFLSGCRLGITITDKVVIDVLFPGYEAWVKQGLFLPTHGHRQLATIWLVLPYVPR